MNYVKQKIIAFMVKTDLISLLILLFMLLGRPLQKAESSVVSNQIGMKFCRIVLQINMHRLVESHFCSEMTRT